MSAFQLTTGHQPFLIPALHTTFSHSESASAFVDGLLLSQAAAHDALIAARTRQSIYSNAHRSEPKPFKVGDFAYFNATDLSFPNLPGKFRPRYIGPYQIMRTLPHDVYEVAFPPAFKIHPVVNGRKLKPFVPNDDARFPLRSFVDDAPAPVHDDQYEIDSILKHRWVANERQFLIKFVGQPLFEARWVAESEMEAPEFIKTYERMRPKAKAKPTSAGVAAPRHPLVVAPQPPATTIRAKASSRRPRM